MVVVISRPVLRRRLGVHGAFGKFERRKLRLPGCSPTREFDGHRCVRHGSRFVVPAQDEKTVGTVVDLIRRDLSAADGA